MVYNNQAVVIKQHFEVELSLVECLVWDQDAAGSSPVTSTIQVTIKNVTCFYFLHNTVEVAGLEGDRAKFRALAKKRR